MRKMTKTAVTLAAMSAMTIASASLAFAATSQVDGLTAIKAETQTTTGPDTGLWNGDNRDGWTFTTDDGIKLKNTWAEIDDIWYYFHKDGIMAQDEILYIDGESYFFNENGAMATGWQQIKSNMDAYSDVEIDPDLFKETNIAVDEDWAYSYHDYVWCYFFENGAAAENEWFQSPESGLWYYFDETVMVMNTMNYVIDAKNYDKDDSKGKAIYGFDTTGAMLTGWNYKKDSVKWKNDPTADAAGRTWYYYASNGKMQQKGWKKLDGNWYLFADNGVNPGKDVDGEAYSLIVNSYVTSYPLKNENPEFFYLDEDGKMQTGIITLPKKLNKVLFYKDDLTIDSEYYEITDSGKPEIYFGSKGAAEEKLIDGRYYTLGEYGKIKVTDVDFDSISKISNTSINVTNAYNIASVTSYDVEGYYGRVIKEALIGYDDKELYLADKEGDIVTYKAVLVQENFTVGTEQIDAYILFDRYGKAYSGYDTKDRSVTIGGKTYWATGEDIEIGGVEVSVFRDNRKK